MGLATSRACHAAIKSCVPTVPSSASRTAVPCVGNPYARSFECIGSDQPSRPPPHPLATLYVCIFATTHPPSVDTSKAQQRSSEFMVLSITARDHMTHHSVRVSETQHTKHRAAHEQRTLTRCDAIAREKGRVRQKPSHSSSQAVSSSPSLARVSSLWALAPVFLARSSSQSKRPEVSDLASWW